jgi:hypothetical protein
MLIHGDRGYAAAAALAAKKLISFNPSRTNRAFRAGKDRKRSAG